MNVVKRLNCRLPETRRYTASERYMLRLLKKSLVVFVENDGALIFSFYYLGGCALLRTIREHLNGSYAEVLNVSKRVFSRSARFGAVWGEFRVPLFLNELLMYSFRHTSVKSRSCK